MFAVKLGALGNGGRREKLAGGLPVHGVGRVFECTTCQPTVPLVRLVKLLAEVRKFLPGVLRLRLELLALGKGLVTRLGGVEKLFLKVGDLAILDRL